MPEILERTLRGLLPLAFAMAPCAALAADTLVEFYNTPLKHYFLSIDAAEAAAIDTGAAGPGWQRTGRTIGAYRLAATAPAGAAAVCRFYGNQAGGGPNGHFYTASAAECAAVKLDPGWTFERVEFYVPLPVNGACPAGSVPVFRAYNGRYAQHDSNHRYTTDTATYNLMIASGWAGEGVVFCGATLATGSFRGNIVLGAPTANAIRANVYSPDQSGAVSIAWGAVAGTYDRQTAPAPLVAGKPVELALTGLAADTRYYYRLNYQTASGAGSGPTDEYSFHTARPPGSTFTFAIQGDSHPEREKSQFDAALYQRTLLTAAADNPDFYMTIGDDFSVDTLDPATVTAAKVTERYTIQRPYLGLIGRSAPVFLVNGNHEQAARYLLDGTPNNVAVWAQNARNAHYAQPAPDGFYTGNAEQVPFIGLLRNYFAWTWGEALFVVIDPYWGSDVCVDNPFDGGPKRPNMWDITHGDEQYQWLKTTLEQSRAKYKFVFAHHVLGTGRGGIELAGRYEWGGENANGTWGFTTNRPRWSSPIHQLLVANKATIFFQGHDHIWVRQQLDGVTYQTLSEPADPNYSLFNADAYASGDKLPNTGYTRVTVGPAGVRVEYVRTYLPADEGTGKASGATVFGYTLP